MPGHGLAGWISAGWLALAVTTLSGAAAPFRLPTPNTALFEPGGESRFYAPTPGRDWTAGSFGCTRTDGYQFHEGIDILATRRDARGEPTDPVYASADGRVAYINTNASLSNYGRYIVLQHSIEGLEIYTLYAHLRSVAEGLRPGQAVRAGQVIGILGRSTNTRTAIAKERAHLHFEIAFRLSDRFDLWFRRTEPNQRNDHGNFNGQNFVGLDPAEILLLQNRLGARFSLVQYVRSLPPLCTVRVHKPDLPWVQRHPLLMVPAAATTEPVVGYDLTFSYQGLPFRIVPLTGTDFPGQARSRLLEVNESEVRNRPCQRMLIRRGSDWSLSHRGQRVLDLLTY